MKVKQIPFYLLVAVAYVMVRALQKTTNDDGTVFPGLPFTP